MPSLESTPPLSTEALSEERKKQELLEHLQSARTFQDVVWLLETYPIWEPARLFRIVEEIQQLDVKNGEGVLGDQLVQSADVSWLREKLEALHNTRISLRKEFEEPRAVEMVKGDAASPAILMHAINLQNIESSSEEVDPVPVVIVGGVNEAPIPLRRFAIELAAHGRSVVGFKVPQASMRADPRHTFPDTIPPLSKAHASSIVTVMNAAEKNLFHSDTQGKQQFDLVGHSYGAINAVFAALNDPARVRNLILLNPAGFANQEDVVATRFIEMALRAGKMEEHFKESVQGSRYQEELHKEMKEEKPPEGYSGSLAHSFTAARVIATVDIVPLLKQLSDRGVRIVVVPAEGDTLFRIEETEKTTQKAGAVIYDLKGQHVNQVFSPGAVAAVITDTLHDMNAHPKSYGTDKKVVGETDAL